MREVKRVLNVEHAWRKGVYGDGVLIAVLDTGSGKKHDDLRDATHSEWNFSDSDTVDDRYGHATHVGGICAGRGVVVEELKGIAPKAKVAWIKVLGDLGSGYTDWIVEGLEKAVEIGAHVVNMSLGAYEKCDGSDALSRATSELWDRHKIIPVVAAGNCGLDCLNRPGIGKSVISVGAADKAFKMASWSSRGHTCDRRWIPVIYGIGVDVCSTVYECQYMWHNADRRRLFCDYGTRKYARYSGTSMATPTVAGVAALALEYARRLGLDEPDAREIVYDSLVKCGDEFGQDVADDEQGRKCVDCQAIFEYIYESVPKETKIVGFALESEGTTAREGETLEVEEGAKVVLTARLEYKDPETGEQLPLEGYFVHVKPFCRWLRTPDVYWEFYPSRGEYGVQVVFPGAGVYKESESGVVKLVVKPPRCPGGRAVARVFGPRTLAYLRKVRDTLLLRGR